MFDKSQNIKPVVKFINVEKKYFLTAAILVLVGVLGIIYGIITGEIIRIWQVYLVNFLFFSGISMAGIVFAAILNLTNAKWGRPIKRIAEGLAVFLPVSFILFLIIYFGRETIFSWITEPVHEKEAWLNFPFMFSRNIICLSGLYFVSIWFLYNSVRPDIGFLSENNIPLLNDRSSLLIKNWKGIETEVNKSENNKTVLSTVVLLAYCLVFTLLAFDLVMSLDPHWYSTLFGVYFFIGNLYLGLAVIAVLSIIISTKLKLTECITTKIFHDLGKLLFAFCILTADFFYSQFLVIWYGNMPEETEYIILRIKQAPWENLSWIVLIVCFVLPFLILIFRKVKVKPVPFFIISCIVIIGMWFERFLLVAPALWHEEIFPFGIIEISITLGFFGLFFIVTGYGFSLFPVIPITDPLLKVRNFTNN